MKQICARSISPPNNKPNSTAMPSTSEVSKRQAANAMASTATPVPRRACNEARRRVPSTSPNSELAWLPTFSGVRSQGSRQIFTPIQAPPTVASMKAHACSENIGMPVKKAARLQPMARRAPKPAMMPPIRPCSRRRLLVGQRRLTLFAHSAAQSAPSSMPMIITPSMRSSGVPARPISLK